jgi:hypothetical protein
MERVHEREEVLDLRWVVDVDPDVRATALGCHCS